jgi:hypothetical protein
MEEEEILGVNLDELSALFDNNSFLGGESFGWGLSPYKNVVINDEGVMVKDESVVLYIDALGDANLSSKMWFYQKKDPLDAYDEPEFSKENLFVKGLGKAIPGVPPFGIIALPWYEVENYDGDTKVLEFPDDTPDGFVPCNGNFIEIDGREFQLPNLVVRVTPSRDEALDDTTEYLAPPGCTYMMRLPYGMSARGLIGRSDSFFKQYNEIKGKLITWGNPADPFRTGRFFY